MTLNHLEEERPAVSSSPEEIPKHEIRYLSTGNIWS